MPIRCERRLCTRFRWCDQPETLGRRHLNFRLVVRPPCRYWTFGSSCCVRSRREGKAARKQTRGRQNPQGCTTKDDSRPLSPTKLSLNLIDEHPLQTHSVPTRPGQACRRGSNDEVAVHVVAILGRYDANHLETVTRAAVDAMAWEPIGLTRRKRSEVCSVLVNQFESKCHVRSVPGVSRLPAPLFPQHGEVDRHLLTDPSVVRWPGVSVTCRVDLVTKCFGGFGQES